MAGVTILEVLPGNRAIVSTLGLFRVAVKDTGEIIQELVPGRKAAATALGFNAVVDDCEACVVAYESSLNMPAGQ